MNPEHDRGKKLCRKALSLQEKDRGGPPQKVKVRHNKELAGSKKAAGSAF